MYAIFSDEGIAIQVPVKKGKSVTGKYYKDVVLKILEKYYLKRHPVMGFKHVRLLHDNTQAHTSAVVTMFLQKEMVTVSPLPPYSPNHAPCDFFIFLNWKPFSLDGDIGPDWCLDLHYTSALLVYLNQHTMTHSGSGLINWNYAFLIMETTLMAWNKEIWDYLHFEHSQSKQAILFKHSMCVYTLDNSVVIKGMKSTRVLF